MANIIGMDSLRRSVDSIKRAVENVEVSLKQLKVLPAIYAELKLANDLKALELGRSENPAEIALIAHTVEEARREPEAKPARASDMW